MKRKREYRRETLTDEQRIIIARELDWRTN